MCYTAEICMSERKLKATFKTTKHQVQFHIVLSIQVFWTVKRPSDSWLTIWAKHFCMSIFNYCHPPGLSSYNMIWTNSAWFPSPGTCDMSSSSNPGVWNEFHLPVPSAWKPIPVMLHTSQHNVHVCFSSKLIQSSPDVCIKISIYATLPLLSQNAHSVQHCQHIPYIHNIQATGCLQAATSCPVARRTWSIHISLCITQLDELSFSADTPYHPAFHAPLHYTQSGQEIQIHVVTSILHINFLFHMPLNFTYWKT
jgi:hypothetical protein